MYIYTLLGGPRLHQFFTHFVTKLEYPLKVNKNFGLRDFSVPKKKENT